jgi:hypothetical protein
MYMYIHLCIACEIEKVEIAFSSACALHAISSTVRLCIP